MNRSICTRIALITALLIAAAGLAAPPFAGAHCQIPCGIYDDHARVQAMLEDAETVIKSARLINELAKKTDAQSQNQLVRWVMNKEQHAQKVIATICDYFLTQRVKPDQEDYAERLRKHHAVMLAAMNAKQHADATYGEALRSAIQELLPYYPAHTH